MTARREQRWLGLALLAAVLALPGGAAAAPLGVHPVAVGTDLAEVQGYCGRQNFLCRRRWSGGPRYRACMADRGCAVRRNNGRNRCRARARFCARRFDRGSPRFGRCLRRGGC